MSTIVIYPNSLNPVIGLWNGRDLIEFHSIGSGVYGDRGNLTLLKKGNGTVIL